MRFWIGNSGDWNDSAHWSTSSGGSGGASVPTSIDDVVVDANSGSSGYTITVNVAANMSSFDASTANNFTLAVNNSFTLHGGGSNGHFKLHPGITITRSGAIVDFRQNVNCNIDTAGVSLGTGDVYIRVGTALRTLLGDLIIEGALSTLFINDGNLNTGGNTVSVDRIRTDTTSSPRTITLGSSLITGPAGYVSIFRLNGANITLNAGTSKIEAYNFRCGGHTFYHVHWKLSPFDTSNGNGNNTFFKLEFEPGVTVTFPASSQQTIQDTGTIIAIGSPGNRIALKSTSIGTSFFFIKTGGHFISCDYLDLSSCEVEPGNVAFYAGPNSTEVAPSIGQWIFDAPTIAASPIDVGVDIPEPVVEAEEPKEIEATPIDVGVDIPEPTVLQFRRPCPVEVAFREPVFVVAFREPELATLGQEGFTVVMREPGFTVEVCP